jgi:hypothetical protein
MVLGYILGWSEASSNYLDGVLTGRRCQELRTYYSETSYGGINPYTLTARLGLDQISGPGP